VAGYSFLDLAYEVLKPATNPLTYQEVWRVAHHGFRSLLKSSGISRL